MPITIPDHAQQAISRLLEQFKGMPKIESMLSVVASEIQAVEDSAFVFFTSRAIDNAVGAQLDGIGRIVSELRNGRVDDSYRLRLKARILANRSSGTIHARAVVANTHLELTPGGFARARLSMTKAAPVMLIPDASVLPDQSTHFVLTVAADGTVSPKQVQVGDLRGGLRVIRSGLAATDRVVIGGIPLAHPGSKVSPHDQKIQYVEDTVDAPPVASR